MSGYYSEYFIEYHSQNTYKEPVTEGTFEFNVSPCNDESQILIDSRVNQNLSDSIFRQNNLFGFEVTRLHTSSKFSEFSFHYRARVQKAKVKLPRLPTLSLDKELDILLSDRFFIEHHLFLRTSPYTCLMEHQLSGIPVYNRDRSTLHYLILLNKYVNELMTYEKNITTVTTSAGAALELGKGVCQDYAHVFIAMARNNRIPTRYVSDYLHQGAEYVGSAFMHAWIEAYVPGMGWIGFDPTNNTLVDEHFIKVSHGADYADCSPIKGVLRTNGDHLMTSQVSVMSEQ